jgi:hypothetical protein
MRRSELIVSAVVNEPAGRALVARGVLPGSRQ